MTNITDCSLQGAAREIVDTYFSDKTSLNDGVTKKASELGLNTEQTQRLIERTNTEAFLRNFPTTTDFEVASPEVVLGIKTASVITLTPKEDIPIEDGLFKAASKNSSSKSEPRVEFSLPTGASPEYQEKIASVADEDIFGINTEEFKKEASATKLEDAIDLEAREMTKALDSITKTASELQQENIARELEFSEHIDTLCDMIKKAAICSVTSISDSESELLSNFPDRGELIHSIYDEVSENLEKSGFPPAFTKRASVAQENQKYTSFSEEFSKIDNILRG